MTKWTAPSANHRETATAARQAPGVWTPVSVYPARESALTVARHIRQGGITAYEPAGSFESYAAVHDDGTAVWARYVDGVTNLAPLPEILTVRVPDYGTQVGYEGVTIKTVVIAGTCRSCGGPRGRVRESRFMRDGAHHACDTWDNACGHADMYTEVLREAQIREDLLRQMLPKVQLLRGIPGGLFADAVDFLGELIGQDSSLPALAGADFLEEAGQVWAAEVVRAFASRGPGRYNKLASSAALYLIDRDNKRAAGDGSTGTSGGAL